MEVPTPPQPDNPFIREALAYYTRQRQDAYVQYVVRALNGLNGNFYAPEYIQSAIPTGIELMLRAYTPQEARISQFAAYQQAVLQEAVLMMASVSTAQVVQRFVLQRLQSIDALAYLNSPQIHRDPIEDIARFQRTIMLTQHDEMFAYMTTSFLHGKPISQHTTVIVDAGTDHLQMQHLAPVSSSFSEMYYLDGVTIEVRGDQTAGQVMIFPSDTDLPHSPYARDWIPCVVWLPGFDTYRIVEPGRFNDDRYFISYRDFSPDGTSPRREVIIYDRSEDPVTRKPLGALLIEERGEETFCKLVLDERPRSNRRVVTRATDTFPGIGLDPVRLYSELLLADNASTSVAEMLSDRFYRLTFNSTSEGEPPVEIVFEGQFHLVSTTIRSISHNGVDYDPTRVTAFQLGNTTVFQLSLENGRILQFDINGGMIEDARILDSRN